MSTATETSIEQRLAVLEAAVTEIRQQLSQPPTASDRVQKISGIMTDDAAFQEMVEYGRAFRQADRPPDDETMPSAPAGQDLVSEPSTLADPTVQELGDRKLTAVVPTTRAPIKRAKLDDKGRLIPLTPAEAAAEAAAIRTMLDELRSIPSDPDEDDAEFFRAIDSHRPHRPLFEGLY